MKGKLSGFFHSAKGRVVSVVTATGALVVAGASGSFAAAPTTDPASAVTTVMNAGSDGLGKAVPGIVAGVALILGLAWVIRAVFIAQKAAKKASNQIGS